MMHFVSLAIWMRQGWTLIIWRESSKRMGLIKNSRAFIRVLPGFVMLSNIQAQIPWTLMNLLNMHFSFLHRKNMKKAWNIYFSYMIHKGQELLTRKSFLLLPKMRDGIWINNRLMIFLKRLVMMDRISNFRNLCFY